MSTPTRRTLTLLAGVIVLLGLRWYVGWKGQQVPPKPTNPLATIDRGSIDGIVLARGDVKVELRRVEGNWRVVALDDLADAGRIENALSDMQGASVSRVAADTTTKLSSFYLEGEQALAVQLLKGTEIQRQFTLGARNSQSTYFLEQGGTRVLELDRAIGSLSPVAESWRSRSILTFDTGGVTEVELRGSAGFTLRKNGATFQVLRGGEATDVPPEKARAYLTTLANLTASGFTTQENAKGMDAPTLTLFVRSGSQEIEMKVGEKNDLGDYPVKTNARKSYFTLGGIDVKGIQEPDFKNDAPSVAPASTLPSLEPPLVSAIPATSAPQPPFSVLPASDAPPSSPSAAP